jgi:hypothetical protein
MRLPFAFVFIVQRRVQDRIVHQVMFFPWLEPWSTLTSILVPAGFVLINHHSPILGTLQNKLIQDSL